MFTFSTSFLMVRLMWSAWATTVIRLQRLMLLNLLVALTRERCRARAMFARCTAKGQETRQNM